MTGQFGGPIAAALFVFWLAFAFFGFILALAGLSALQNYIYKQDNVYGRAIQLSLMHAWGGRTLPYLLATESGARHSVRPKLSGRAVEVLFNHPANLLPATGSPTYEIWGCTSTTEAEKLCSSSHDLLEPFLCITAPSIECAAGSVWLLQVLMVGLCLQITRNWAMGRSCASTGSFCSSSSSRQSSSPSLPLLAPSHRYAEKWQSPVSIEKRTAWLALGNGG